MGLSRFIITFGNITSIGLMVNNMNRRTFLTAVTSLIAALPVVGKCFAKTDARQKNQVVKLRCVERDVAFDTTNCEIRQFHYSHPRTLIPVDQNTMKVFDDGIWVMIQEGETVKLTCGNIITWNRC